MIRISILNYLIAATDLAQPSMLMRARVHWEAHRRCQSQRHRNYRGGANENNSFFGIPFKSPRPPTRATKGHLGVIRACLRALAHQFCCKSPPWWRICTLDPAPAYRLCYPGSLFAALACTWRLACARTGQRPSVGC